ncbi:hypothetical protein H0H92_014102, partial [Tricholoma furcatifolium]
MVAEERIRRSEVEEELKEATLEKDALRSALRLLEGHAVTPTVSPLPPPSAETPSASTSASDVLLTLPTTSSTSSEKDLQPLTLPSSIDEIDTIEDVNQDQGDALSEMTPRPRTEAEIQPIAEEDEEDEVIEELTESGESDVILAKGGDGESADAGTSVQEHAQPVEDAEKSSIEATKASEEKQDSTTQPISKEEEIHDETIQSHSSSPTSSTSSSSSLSLEKVEVGTSAEVEDTPGEHRGDALPQEHGDDHQQEHPQPQPQPQTPLHPL